MKIAVEIDVSSAVYNEESLRKVVTQLAHRLDGYVYDSIDNAPIGIGDGPINRGNFTVSTSIKLVK